MEAKHSKGPWHAEPEEASEGRGIAICAADAIVATILPKEEGPQLDELDWANAHLIAAAPDLLAALEEIDQIAEGALNKTGLPPALALRAVVDQAYSAIAKAKGGA